MITKLYLAHPILEREWIRKEEARIEQELGIELINPFYDNAERNDMKRVDAGQLTVYDDNKPLYSIRSSKKQSFTHLPITIRPISTTIASRIANTISGSYFSIRLCRVIMLP